MNPNPQTPYAPYPYAPAPPPRPAWKPRLAVLLPSLVIYLLACVTPALRFPGDNVWPGFAVLLLGWMAAFVGVFAWLANPLYLLSLVLLLARRWLGAAILAALALLLAATTFQLFFTEMPMDEGNVNRAKLAGLGIGFFFWVLSMLVALGGALALRFKSQSPDSRA